ncbi:MAG: YqgE/AlgH family protein [Candidatus Brocadiaceae bacterium]|nr:YqgE/AlgH family protein [Candidatus Brocadiaceae bacterium]
MSTFLKKGTYLIANPEGTDPNFMRTVVLVCDHNEQGAFGLILNRTLEITISQILPNNPHAIERNELIYFGGPVETSKLFCLHGNQRNNIYNCDKICDGVYLGTNQACLNDWLISDHIHNGFRLYLGYSGWAGGQLENEIEMNYWIVGPANGNIVFYPNPENIWWYILHNIGGHESGDSFDSPYPSLN